MKSKNKKNSSFILILCSSFIIISSTLIIFTKIRNTTNSPSSNNPCVRSGCSGQLCIEKSQLSEKGFSTCEWKDVYQCYQLATCEKQSTGQCAFTENTEFKKCLKQNSPSFKLIH